MALNTSPPPEAGALAAIQQQADQLSRQWEHPLAAVRTFASLDQLLAYTTELATLIEHLWAAADLAGGGILCRAGVLRQQTGGG